MYPKILEAQSPDIASRIFGTLQVHYVLPVCLHVAYTTLYANDYVSLGLNLNLKAPAASFTTKCLKNTRGKIFSFKMRIWCRYIAPTSNLTKVPFTYRNDEY